MGQKWGKSSYIKPRMSPGRRSSAHLFLLDLLDLSKVVLEVTDLLHDALGHIRQQLRVQALPQGGTIDRGFRDLDGGLRPPPAVIPAIKCF